MRGGFINMTEEFKRRMSEAMEYRILVAKKQDKEYLEKIATLINKGFEVQEAISSVELPKYKKPKVAFNASPIIL